MARAIHPAAILVLALGLLPIAAGPALAAAGDWPQFRGDTAHTGYNSSETTISSTNIDSLGMAWTGATGGAVYSSPAVANGVVYVGSSDGKLYAFAVGCASAGGTCTPLWTADTGAVINGSPSVADGVVYVASGVNLYAFDATGVTGCSGDPKTCTPLWVGPTTSVVRSSPTVAAGVVYIGSADGKLYAFSVGCASGGASCTPLWTAPTGGQVNTSAAVSGNRVYVGSDDGKLYAFATPCAAPGGECSPLWVGDTGTQIGSSPVVYDGRVYVGSFDDKIYVYEVDCSDGGDTCDPLWTTSVGGSSRSPAVANGVLYAAGGTNLYAFDAGGGRGCTGTPKVCDPLWLGAIGNSVTSPSVANDVLYVGSGDHKLYAFDADCGGAACGPLWSAATGGTLALSSPSIANGIVYIGSGDGKLYAFGLHNHLVLSPATASVAPGVAQAYTAEAFDADGNSLGDVTADTTFTISGGGSCTGNSCSGPSEGDYTVTGTDGAATGTAALHVTYYLPGDWPQFGREPAHRAENQDETVLSPANVGSLGVAWTADLHEVNGNSSPAVAGGVVYVGSPDGTLYAFEVGCATGGASCTPIWTAATGGKIDSSPAVSGNVVYVGSADGYLYAFAVGCASGGGSCSPIWRGKTDDVISSSPTVADGFVYVGSDDGKLRAFKTGCASGGGICLADWEGTIGNAIFSSPAVADGVVYVASYHSLYAYAVGCATGGGYCGPLWQASTGDIIYSSPTVADGVVYVGSMDGKLYAFDAHCGTGGATCTPVWTATTGAAIGSSSAVAGGVVYIGSNDGKLYAFAVGCASGGGTCSPIWTATTAAEVVSRPAIANGVVYVGSVDGGLYAFAVGCSTGGGTCSPLYHGTAGAPIAILSSPAVSAGVVYVASSNGHLYAYGLDHGALSFLILSPDSATIQTGANQAFTANGWDAFLNSWDVTSTTTFSVDSPAGCSGNVCTSDTAGHYTVTGTNGTATGTAALVVTTLDHLVLTPASATVTPGGNPTFRAEGFDTEGNSVGDVTASTTFTVAGGTCTGNSCSAGAPGDHLVTATSGSASGTAILHVFQLAAGDWPQFRNKATHDGSNGAETIISPANVASLDLGWTGYVGGYTQSSPAVADGVVYFGSDNGNFYAFDADCARDGGTCDPLWVAATGPIYYSSPAVADGVVYLGSSDGKLYAFDARCGTGGATCTPLWTGQTGASIFASSPTVVDGVVYVGSLDGKLYAFAVGCNTGGGACSPLWTGLTGSLVSSSPAVSGGVVYVGSYDGRLYAFAVGCNTGGGACNPLWTGLTGSPIFSSPAVAGGVVYVGSYNSKLYAFAVGCNTGGGTCAPLWTGETGVTGSGIGSSPAVVDGVVYVASDVKLYAFDAAGETGCSGEPKVCSPLWSGATGNSVFGSPAVANGLIYIGSYDRKLYAFQVGCGSGGGSCSPVWTYQTTDPIGYSSPAVAGGMVYVASLYGKLYSFRLYGLDHLALNPADATITAGGSQTYAAEGFDAYGESLGDMTSSTVFAVGGGSCTGTSCTSIVAGDQTVTGTSGSATGHATLHVLAGPLDHLGLSPADATIVSGGSQPYTAEGLDQYGNSLGDMTASTSFAIGGGGSCTGAACTSTVAGDHTVTGTSGTATGSATLHVAAGTLHHLTVSPATANIPAGGSQNYGVEGFDQYGNSLGDLTSSTTFDIDGGGSCTGASCTSTVAGNHTVTATNATITGTAILHVTAGALDHLILSPASATIAAGGSQDYTAEGFDTYGNSLGDVTGATTFSMAGGSCTAAACGSTVAGDYTITGLDGGASGTATLHVSPGPVTHLSVAGFTSPHLAGDPGTVTVQSRDAYENVVPGYSGTVHLTSTDAAAVLPADYSFVPGDEGSHTFAVTLNSVAVQTIAATDVATPSITGSQTGIVVQASATPGEASTYVPINPARILDTRPTNSTYGWYNIGLAGPFTPGTVRTFQVAGAPFVGGGTAVAVPVGASAVTGNLTVTRQSAIGLLALGPTMTATGEITTLNFVVGENRANNVTLALAPDGTLSVVFRSSAPGASVDVIFDITGYFLPGDGYATYHTLSPGRVLDTRPTSGGVTNIGLKGKFANRTVRTIAVAGVAALGWNGAKLVPANATAVTGNLTVTNATSAGYVAIGPSTSSYPKTSTLNTRQGRNTANGITVALNAGRLQAVWVGTSGSSADVILDITGYFTADGSGLKFYPIAPYRVLDSSVTNKGLSGVFATEVARTLQVGGTGGDGGVPLDAQAIAGNLTVVGPSSNGYAFIAPVIAGRPSSSTVNTNTGVSAANGFDVPLDPTGWLTLIWVGNVPGSTSHVQLDVTGYWK